MNQKKYVRVKCPACKSIYELRSKDLYGRDGSPHYDKQQCGVCYKTVDLLHLGEK